MEISRRRRRHLFISSKRIRRFEILSREREKYFFGGGGGKNRNKKINGCKRGWLISKLIRTVKKRCCLDKCRLKIISRVERNVEESFSLSRNVVCNVNINTAWRWIMIREKICKFQTPFLRYSHRISRFNERAQQILLINAKFTFVAYLSVFIDLDLHSVNSKKRLIISQERKFARVDKKKPLWLIALR